MPATFDFNLEQIKSLILQFSADEKIELAKYMDKLTLKNRFEKFFDSIEEVPLSFEDITTAVEAVREERFKYQSKNPK
jgi:hypothetical protein